jgi:ubiquinone/menaquinone biosynthesis C-methylase UbiE
MSQPSLPPPALGYEEFFGPAIFDPLARALLDRATPRPGERVLDLACGTGIVTRRLASLVGADGAVVGLDLSADMLAVAEALAPPPPPVIEWRQGDAMDLPLADGAFDLVVCQQGLQFVPDRAAAVREMRRVAGAGGRVALNVWQALDRHPVFRPLCEAESRRLGVPLADVSVPFSFESAEELRGYLAAAGFPRIEIAEAVHQARFPSLAGFVERTIQAAAAVIPDIPEEPGSLVAAISEELRPVLESHRIGDGIAFPMPYYLAVASA